MDEFAGKVAVVSGAAMRQRCALARRLAAAGVRIVAGDVLTGALTTVGEDVCRVNCLGPFHRMRGLIGRQLLGLLRA